jgi:hypothetical protein
MDNGYGRGVPIEFGRIAATALQLMNRGSLKSPPKRGCRNEGCGTDNVLNYPVGRA